MRDDAEPAQAEQVGAALQLRVDLLAEAAERGRAAAGRRASRASRTSRRRAPRRAIVCETPSISFSAMLPVKPSVTTTSATPLVTSPPSTLPTNSNASLPAPTRSSSSACASSTSGLPRLLLAVRQQPDARARDAEHGARQRRAHERELHEVLAPHVGVRADVEQRHRARRDRQRQRERRAVDAARALDVEQPGGERGAGPAGADERLRPAVGDGARRLDDRRIGRARAPRSPGRRSWRSRPARRRPRRRRRARRARRPARTGSRARPRAAASAAPAATSAGAEIGAVAVDRDDRAVCGARAIVHLRSSGQWLERHRRATRRGRARDRGRARPARRPRGPRRSRRPGRPGAGGAGCGTAGTRSPPACRSCAARGAWPCGCAIAFSWGPP